jgi:hypothetical protein
MFPNGISSQNIKLIAFGNAFFISSCAQKQVFGLEKIKKAHIFQYELYAYS